MRRAIKLSLALAISACVLALSSCASTTSGPREWHEKNMNDVTYEDVATQLRAILSGPEFQYTIRSEDWEEFPESEGIAFNTTWNDRFVRKAVFSGTGVRRRVWVEVFSDHQDLPPEFLNPKTQEKMSEKARSNLITVGNDVKRRAVSIAIGVEAQRNMNIRAPNDPRTAEWSRTEDDQEEYEQIYANLLRAMNSLKGVDVDISKETERAWRKYRMSPGKTPEESYQDYKDSEYRKAARKKQ